MDETYVKVAGVWRYVYRAVDQHGQVIDVYVSARRDIPRRGGSSPLRSSAHAEPEEVVTDRAPGRSRTSSPTCYPWRSTTPSDTRNNRVECDHGRLKARLRPMRGLKTDPTARVIIRGHAFMQNLRRGHYELGVEARNRHLRIAAAFDELAEAI